MRDIVPALRKWLAESQPFALATVVRTWGSSPRPVGAAMAVARDGRLAGSVSGGCVEGAVIEACLRVLESGEPEVLTFGAITNERAWEVGLSCGGEIEVWVSRAPPDADALVAALESNRPVVRVLRRTPHLEWWGTDPDGAPAECSDAVRAAWQARESTFEAGLFVHFIGRRPALVVIGAGHIAIPLVAMAHTLGFRTVVIDPRSAFARQDRFEVVPDELVCAWPGEAMASWDLHGDLCAVCLSHDPKIDEPALRLLLPSRAGYVGALGSRTTQAQRRESLLASGLSEADVSRLHGPVGLAIGARTPEEIAVSILAQIVQVRRAAG